MKITAQETFNRVAKHLLTQNEKAQATQHQNVVDGVLIDCYYRAPNGFKCAVGCLIPDDKYDPSFEGKAVHPLSAQTNVGAFMASLGYDLALLNKLQTIHDYDSVEHWPEQLTLFAEKHGLNTDIFAKI